MAEGFFGSDYAEKAASAGLVLLLHLLLLAVLLSLRMKVQESEPRESILRLIPLLRAAPSPPVPAAPAPRAVPLHRPPPVLSLPPPVQPAPAEPSATVLGPTLNDCALENLNNLPPEQRAKCASYQTGVAGAAQAKERAGLNQPTRSKSATDWAQAIVKRDTPAKVDCARVETQQFGVQENLKATRLMVDLGCAARHLINRQSPIN